MTQQPNQQPEVIVRPEKIIEVLKSIALTVQAEGITGNEYVTILGNLVAQVLSENPKKLEKDFLANVKRDTLQRRIRKLDKPSADRIVAAEAINAAMQLPALEEELSHIPNEVQTGETA